jgi:hypothetical protein
VAELKDRPKESRITSGFGASFVAPDMPLIHTREVPAVVRIQSGPIVQEV